MMRGLNGLIPVLVLMFMLASCGGSTGIDNPAPEQLANPAGTGLPSGPGLTLPEDRQLPWEELDANGFVDPATARMSSAINGNSEFWRGVDAFEVDGDTSNFGQALRLNSGSAGSAERSSATFRIPLAGENPATLSTDINLRLRSDGSPSSFYIGIANYSAGRWDWSGPFSDGRIRLPVDEAASGDYISGLGNAFITVVAYSGSSFDIVGVGFNQFDPGDVNAPPVPTGLTLGSRIGALELQWNGVLAGDLAGYRIYFSDKSFVNPNSVGVRHVPYLEGGTRHLLAGVSGTTFVAVSAVDLNSNESDITAVMSAAALAGDGPVLELEADTASGIVGDPIALSASGADAYDWDLDGDGTYEITGDVSGSQLADTGTAGIIRPAVRGSDGGTAVALGAVSLVVSSDLPPVAVLTANRTSGVIMNGESSPLTVNFDATPSYDDGGSLEYSWSPLGDGSFSSFSATGTTSHGYSSSGIYTAMVQVRDSAMQVAYALLPITVEQVTGFRETKIESYPAGLFGSLAIVDGKPALAYRWFGPSPEKNGLFYRRALDSEGKFWGEPVPIRTEPDYGDFACLEVINGNPAIVYFNINSGNIEYRRAANSTGQTQADWPNPPVNVGPGVFPAEELVLREVDGQPAFIWYEGGDLWYRRANSGSGNIPGDWVDPAIKIVGTGNVDIRPDFAIIDGNPAVAYRDWNLSEAHYLRSTTSTGASALDWPGAAVKVSGGDSCDGRVNLARIAGAPAVSFFTANSLRYTRATTSTGINEPDWPLAVVIDKDFSQGNTWHDLAEIGGRPALAYSDFEIGSRTSYRRAANSSGSAWGPEMHVAPGFFPWDTAYERIMLRDLNGFPAIYVWYSSWDRPMFYTFETEL